MRQMDGKKETFHANEIVYLRRCTMRDAEVILEWVNDPMDRANSFNSNIISLEEHIKWLKESLVNPNRELYIMMRGDIPIGHVKLYIDGNVAEVGYCIAPEWRNKGYGKLIIELITEKAKNNGRIKRIFANVKNDNVASRKAFTNAGYTEESIRFVVETDNNNNRN